jgi:hypothetical protein
MQAASAVHEQNKGAQGGWPIDKEIPSNQHLGALHTIASRQQVTCQSGDENAGWLGSHFHIFQKCDSWPRPE